MTNKSEALTVTHDIVLQKKKPQASVPKVARLSCCHLDNEGKLLLFSSLALSCSKKNEDPEASIPQRSQVSISIIERRPNTEGV